MDFGQIIIIIMMMMMMLIWDDERGEVERKKSHIKSL